MKVAACLKGTSLTEDDLDRADTVVTGAQELRIIRNLMALTENCPGVAAEAGARYQLASAGILGFALLSSPTLGDALSVALRFSQLSSTFHKFTEIIENDECVLALEDDDIPSDVRDFVLERDLTAIAGITPILFGGTLPTGVHVIVRVGTDSPLHVLTERVPVEFNGARNALVIPAHQLGAPLPSADPHTAELCVRQCQELLDLRRARTGIAGAVRSQLLRDPARVPAMRAIASGMHIGERTLHRRLAREGTSYRALLDEVRETLAKELLTNGFTVKEVSDRLGYSEPAAFTHAYTRWRGAPPSTHLT